MRHKVKSWFLEMHRTSASSQNANSGKGHALQALPASRTGERRRMSGRYFVVSENCATIGDVRTSSRFAMTAVVFIGGYW